MLEEVARSYSDEEYGILALDEIYPGIVMDVPKEEHRAGGNVDILLEHESQEDSIFNLEVGVTGSVCPDTLESMVERKHEKVQKNRDYFEGLGMDFRSDVVIYPEGNLEIVYELFSQYSDSFTRSQAVDTAKKVSEAGRLGNMFGDEIILEGVSSTGTELYEINEEKYGEVIDICRSQEFYP